MLAGVSDRQSEFAVSFEGSSVANNTMDVRELAPALIALGQAFDRANSLLNGDRASISLNIRATRPGSFEIALILDQILQGASDILAGEFLTDAATLTELLVGGPVVAGSVFRALKWLRGRKPRAVAEEDDAIVLEADNVRLRVPTKIVQLLNDRPLKEQIEAFVRPLQGNGVDRVVFKQNDRELESITRDEAEYFDTGYEEDNVTKHLIPRQRLQ